MDPASEKYAGWSPYNSMMNSPLVFTDPYGDDPISLLVGAVVGVVGNGVGNLLNDRPFFRGAGQAAFFGAFGGGVSAGIGNAASGLVSNGASQFGVAAFQAGAHGLSGGVLSAVQGGNFWHGAAAGAFSSTVGSGIGVLGLGDGWQIFGGTLSGGFGSVVAGGNFLQGVLQGAITSGLNHAAHNLFGPDDPPKVVDVKRGAGGSMILYYDDGSVMFLPAQGTINSTPAPWEYLMGAGLLRSGTSAATVATAGSSRQLVRAGFQSPRWWRKFVFSSARTGDGGRVITLFNKFKYVGYRQSTHGAKYGYTRSIKINTGGSWKHWLDW